MDCLFVFSSFTAPLLLLLLWYTLVNFSFKIFTTTQSCDISQANDYAWPTFFDTNKTFTNKQNSNRTSPNKSQFVILNVHRQSKHNKQFFLSSTFWYTHKGKAIKLMAIFNLLQFFVINLIYNRIYQWKVWFALFSTSRQTDPKLKINYFVGAVFFHRTQF